MFMLVSEESSFRVNGKALNVSCLSSPLLRRPPTSPDSFLRHRLTMLAEGGGTQKYRYRTNLFE